MRIKEGDEWKEAFTMHMSSFEPTVMFFGMVNSPAIFQVMMNEILRDLINKGKVAVFVDDILVGTEIEEGITNFIWPYIHQFFDNSHGLIDYRKPSKRPFN